MKRTIMSLILILALIVSLSSCTVDDQSNEPDIFVKLNELLDNDISSYTLEVNVEAKNDMTVKEKYTVTDGSVVLRIERINPFTVGENGIEAPESYKTVTEQTLSENEQKQYDFALPKFKFTVNALDKVTASKGKVYGSVVSPKIFMGKDIDADNIGFTAKYDSDSVNAIILSYTTHSGNSVTVIYTFN